MNGHLTTDQKGEIAVLKVREEALKKGAVISVPTIPARYDLVLDYQGRFYRAQVKYAEWQSSNCQGAVRVELRRRKQCYTKDEIDILLVYVAPIDRVLWFGPEVFHDKVGLQVRWQPCKNRQKSGCRMAEDFIW
ncbi:MAG TPA: group I intron-associated PD-(D/E)XK endonuclease [Gemmataceae bacterium]|nr:group I intron-associated PD-(D/E)XK endonuclease [Gemmataceae bacterium]